MGKHEKKKQKPSIKKILLVILIIVLVLAIIRLIVNSLCGLALVKYIQDFEAVAYEGERAIPQIDKQSSHYCIQDKDGLKIMMLNDLHIGAGPYTTKEDKKAIYEVITMLQVEKPDLVILAGDNVFCCPGPIFNGGGTFNNYMAQRIVMEIFEHEEVYYSLVFGNHESESYDFVNREGIGQLFENGKSAGGSNKYCIYKSEYKELDKDAPSISNQFINITDEKGNIKKLILLIDSNDYLNRSITAAINWKYDAIHDTQVEWAKQEIVSLSKLSGLSDGEYLPVISFMHMPIGEFQTAYVELEANGFNDTENTKYLEGVWDEEINEKLGTRVLFGGCGDYLANPNEADKFFEVLGPDGMNVLEGVFCGHDHTNTVSVEYKGVPLVYGQSIDNIAYDGIAYSGIQRGCLVFTIQDSQLSWTRKNAYLDLGVDPNKFVEVYLDHFLYENVAPSLN